MPQRSVGGVDVSVPEWYDLKSNLQGEIKKKPRKEVTVSSWHDRLSNASQFLVFSGVKTESIKAYSLEPWTEVNVRKAIKWFDTVLKVRLDRLIVHLDTQKPEYWKSIRITFPNHIDIRNLRMYQTDIRTAWYTRPRFKSDKGRVLEEGY